MQQLVMRLQTVREAAPLHELLLSILMERLAGGGEAHGTFIALQQPLPQLILHASQGSANRGRTQMHALSGLPEMERLCKADEQLEFPGIHAKGSCCEIRNTVC